jgi:thiamine pyrophosphate-dependent acetolactate synthase large subunit-like protein
MKYIECMEFLASRRSTQLVVTSAGQSRNAWWHATHDKDASFYLGASMSMSTMFAAGIAACAPDLKVWAFMGDGAFCMNPGMLMVERDLNLPNLTHFLISNRHYGATGNQPLPNRQRNDYQAIARAMGVERTFGFGSVRELEDGFDAAVLPNTPAYTFVVLELEPGSEKMDRCPIDGPELKFAFGRNMERITNRKVFGAKH